MIVTCDKCTTRFRIADDKITADGVKVRCSRCAHVFVVTAPPTAASGTSAGPNVSPNVSAMAQGFATDFGPDDPHDKTGRVEASVMSALVASTIPSAPTLRSSDTSIQGTPRDASPADASSRNGLLTVGGTAASSAEVAAALGFSGVQGGEFTNTGLAPVGSNTKPISRPGSASLPLEASDFSDLDEAFRKALAEPSERPSSMARGTEEDGPVLLGAGGVGIEASPTSAARRASDDLGRGSADVEPSESFLGATYEHGPKSASLVGDRFPPPSSLENAISGGPPKPQSGFPLPPSAPFSSDSGDLPGLLAPADDDPFANIDAAAPSPASSISLDLLSPAERPLPPEPILPMRADADPFPQLELARNPYEANRSGLEATAVVHTYSSRPPPAVPVVSPAAQDGRWPTLAGILLGLVIVVGLLPDLGQRAVDALVPPSWAVEWSGAVSSTPLQIKGARVTQYPTDRGLPLLVVAGDARNQSDEPLSGVEVVVTVYEGARKVDERRAWVDVVLTEGQLSAVSDAEDLTATYNDAFRAHGSRGVILPPKAERPFMVVFPEVPSNVERLRFRVSFVIPDA